MRNEFVRDELECFVRNSLIRKCKGPALMDFSVYFTLFRPFPAYNFIHTLSILFNNSSFCRPKN
jgi:hypothetical protein